jgi:hypothetical protein
MFCQKCGKENRDGAEFCNSCGTPLNQTVKVPETGPTQLSKPPKPPQKKRGILFWAGLCIGILIVVFVGAAIVGAIVFGTSSSPSSSPETVKTAIKVHDTSYTTRTNVLASTKTFTVTGTFTNTGTQTYTFFGGLSLFDSNYNTLSGGYEGETMTLAPGQSQTISENFVCDISVAEPAGIAYKVDTPAVTSTPTPSSSCAVFVEGKYTSTTVPSEITSATLQTLGNGKAQLIMNSNTGTETDSISYYPGVNNDPCQGMYYWKGVSQNNQPVSGNFGVIGRNPDKIAMFNDAWGNYDEIDFVRVQ